MIRALERSGKSKIGIAHALNIPPSQVTLMLMGERRIRADELLKMAEYFEYLDRPIPVGPHNDFDITVRRARNAFFHRLDQHSDRLDEQRRRKRK
jgi:hypothetical protein